VEEKAQKQAAKQVEKAARKAVTKAEKAVKLASTSVSRPKLPTKVKKQVVIDELVIVGRVQSADKIFVASVKQPT
jgi:hypothetical protein